ALGQRCLSPWRNFLELSVAIPILGFVITLCPFMVRYINSSPYPLYWL
ncbi:unnamed protein product, partial [Brassica oleracea]